MTEQRRRKARFVERRMEHELERSLVLSRAAVADERLVVALIGGLIHDAKEHGYSVEQVADALERLRQLAQTGRLEELLDA